jgi:putative addiction module killer protein
MAEKMIIERTNVYIKWFEKLKDRKAKGIITKRLLRIEESGNLGNVRPLGNGVSEIKIDYGAGYRIYYTMRGSEIILLLIGADKSRQEEDVSRAKNMVKQISQGAAEWLKK